MGRLATITRRTFLFGAAVIAGGAAFGYYKYKQEFPNPLGGDLAEGESTLNPFLKIGADNAITIIVPRAEMGQGVMTTLAALVAEELDVTLDQVAIEHGPPGEAYFNNTAMKEGAPFPAFDDSFMAETVRGAMGVLGKILGMQTTGGSTSTVDGYEKMRVAGAAAREMLKAAAAKKLGVAAATLTTKAGMVTDPASGKSLSYGELAADAAKETPPSEIALRDPKDWTILGKSQMRKDMPAKVTGQPVFGIDVTTDDMLYATVRMNPHLGGGIGKIDLDAAKDMRGVKKVVPLDGIYGHGFAVIADNTWRAFQAADAIAATAEWQKAAYPDNSAEMEAVLDKTLTGEEGFTLRTLGNVETAFADAPRERIVEAEYYAPFLSHAAMEPMNATARLKDGFLDVWTPCQGPTLVRDIGATLTGLPVDKIRVHVPMMGGGFGRRIETDFSEYAIRLAMAMPGQAIKVTWTREEDFTHSPFRPVAKARYRGLIDAAGKPTALSAVVASPSVIASVAGRLFPSVPMGGPDNAVIDGAWNQPYKIADYQVEGRKAPIAVPTTFWRSVGNSFNAFMHESFIDEMAHAGKQDPLALRRELMADYPVALGLLDKVAEMSDWKTPLPAGKGRGLAFTLSFGTWVAEVVQVGLQDDMIRVEHVWCAADPGIVMDERNYKAQLMSGIIYGLSATIGQAITFADGKVEQMNFSDHDGMRMYQCPKIDIELLTNSPHMGGAGEPGTPPVMAALANAIFAATGKRVRRMPLNGEVTFV